MAIIDLQIIGFHNCDGCSRKVRTAARRIGVEIMEFDRENGIFTITISTSENPQVIRYAFERQLKKPVVLLSRDLIIPANQNPNSIVSHQVPANPSLDLQELGQVVVRLAQVLDDVEITNSNTIRISFNHRDGDDDVVYGVRRPPPRSPPWVATEPSAPLMPVAEEVVYGYPADYYGVYTPRSRRDQQDGCCIIL